MSNNCEPEFTDEEAMTVYLFGIIQGHNKVKNIHQYAQQHLLSWFPKLPSYQAFDNRLNHLCYAFEINSVLND